jgi:chromosome segregation ATPase
MGPKNSPIKSYQTIERLKQQLVFKDCVRLVEREKYLKEAENIKNKFILQFNIKDEQLAEATRDITSLTDNLEKALKIIDELETKKAECEKRAAEKEEECMQMTQQIAKLEKDNMFLLQEYNDLTERIHALSWEYEKRLKETESDVEQLSDNLEKTIRIGEDLLNKYKVVSRTLKDKEFQYITQKQQLDNFTKQYERINSKYEALSNSKLGRLTLLKWKFTKKLAGYL